MQPSKVELTKQAQRYQLSVDGKPFYIKGAGLELGSIESLADYGGNAFRTWRVDNGAKSGLGSPAWSFWYVGAGFHAA